MEKVFEAVFDGLVLRPDEPLALEPHTRVRLIIDATFPPHIAQESFLDTAKSLALEGPTDWSENLERYLYGNRVRDAE